LILHAGVDGIELAATIRKLNPQQPIAFQTASRCGDSVIQQRMATYAVSDLPYIEKPFSVEQLLLFIQSVTEKYGKPLSTT